MTSKSRLHGLLGSGASAKADKTAIKSRAANKGAAAAKPPGKMGKSLGLGEARTFKGGKRVK